MSIERRLGLARAALVELPDLMDELARCKTERVPSEGGSRGKPGSRSPMRDDVLVLIDERRKPGWEGDDPRLAKLSARYGVAPLLETWTRVLTEELPEYPDLAEHATVRTEAAVLVEHWGFIAEQQWANELVDDVLTVTGWVKVALAMRPEPKYVCPQCGERANLVAGGFLTCANQHEQSVRDLEAQYRRKPAATTSDLASEFGIQAARIRKWAERKAITPVRTEGRAAMYLPWDVFCMMNPDIRAALDERDTAEAS